MNSRLAIAILFANLSLIGFGQTTPPAEAHLPARAIGEATRQNPKYIQVALTCRMDGGLLPLERRSRRSKIWC